MSTTVDLTSTTPRSANERMAGIVSLARTLDKARASADDRLGEYHYDCPHDKPLFAFLGLDAETFRRHAVKYDDAAFENWIENDVLANTTAAEREAFNEERRAWKPEPGTDSAKFFDELRAQVAPDRTDVTTWFDLFDLDEGRHVATAHR